MFEQIPSPWFLAVDISGRKIQRPSLDGLEGFERRVRDPPVLCEISSPVFKRKLVLPECKAKSHMSHEVGGRL